VLFGVVDLLLGVVRVLLGVVGELLRVMDLLLRVKGPLLRVVGVLLGEMDLLFRVVLRRMSVGDVIRHVMVRVRGGMRMRSLGRQTGRAGNHGAGCQNTERRRVRGGGRVSGRGRGETPRHRSSGISPVRGLVVLDPGSRPARAWRGLQRRRRGQDRGLVRGRRGGTRGSLARTGGPGFGVAKVGCVFQGIYAGPEEDIVSSSSRHTIQVTTNGRRRTAVVLTEQTRQETCCLFHEFRIVGQSGHGHVGGRQADGFEIGVGRHGRGSYLRSRGGYGRNPHRRRGG